MLYPLYGYGVFTLSSPSFVITGYSVQVLTCWVIWLRILGNLGGKNGTAKKGPALSIVYVHSVSCQYLQIQEGFNE